MISGRIFIENGRQASPKIIITALGKVIAGNGFKSGCVKRKKKWLDDKIIHPSLGRIYLNIQCLNPFYTTGFFLCPR